MDHWKLSAGAVDSRKGTGAQVDDTVSRHAAARTTDVRPWGSFERYSLNQVSTVKIITVLPGQQLSLQRHARRDELWVIVDQGLEVMIGERVERPSVGSEYFIPRHTLHRLSCVGERSARLLEVAFGVFDECDIERLADIYDRI